MTVSAAIRQATRSLLYSERFRTYEARGREYTLDIRREGKSLVVHDWGYDREAIAIPETLPEAVGLKVRCQLGLLHSEGVRTVALRYYLEIAKGIS